MKPALLSILTLTVGALLVAYYQPLVFAQTNATMNETGIGTAEEIENATGNNTAILLNDTDITSTNVTVLEGLEKEQNASEQAINQTGETLQTAANETGEAAQTTANETGEALQTAANETGEAAEATGQNISEVGENISESAESIGNQTGEAAETAVNTTGNIFEDIGQTIANFFNGTG